jgi:hypothetical protein
MKLTRSAAACFIVCAAALATGAPRGTAPRATADKYPAHADQNTVAIGATLLTEAQVRKAFFADVNRCCVVVEVALYPQADQVTEPSLDDFALRVVGQDVASKPTTPKTAALHGSKDSDRLHPRLIFAMEEELSEKALPEGPTSTPVSGYLYFPKDKKGKYQLEYTLHGKTVVLPLH